MHEDSAVDQKIPGWTVAINAAAAVALAAFWARTMTAHPGVLTVAGGAGSVGIGAAWMVAMIRSYRRGETIGRWLRTARRFVAVIGVFCVLWVTAVFVVFAGDYAAEPWRAAIVVAGLGGIFAALWAITARGWRPDGSLAGVDTNG